MNKHIETPYGYVGHYSETNKWSAYHYKSRKTTAYYNSMLEARDALRNLEIAWLLEPLKTL
jgi:hypothetical protein